jgi:tRNA-specific 2-thiouridylase
MSSSGHVVVAMSGGVDSSVAAALLVQQGYQVTGMMLRLWSEPGSEATNRCCTPDAMHMARRVAGRLGIPFYAVDAQETFKQTVVDTFITEYAQFVTPNPCLVCNRQIRWGLLYQRARAIGADFMATGHYARSQQDDQGSWQLLRAVDQKKDQSYVLHVLQQDQLAHSIFPLGEYTKSLVRQLAHQFNLPVAKRPESQDLCFLGNGDYRNFLIRNADNIQNPGPILDRSGKKIGEHQGLAFYTIGQRKGIRIASPIPLYVLEKNPVHNALIVGPLEELGQDELIASRVNWVSGKGPEKTFEANIKIRYKAQEVAGIVTPLSDQKVHIKFSTKLRDITPGQAAVFYADQVCLGGGIIRPN